MYIVSEGTVKLRVPRGPHWLIEFFDVMEYRASFESKGSLEICSSIVVRVCVSNRALLDDELHMNLKENINV